MWDRKYSVRVTAQPDKMGQVCGLCGNYNGDSSDDLILGPNGDQCVANLPSNYVLGAAVS